MWTIMLLVAIIFSVLVACLLYFFLDELVNSWNLPPGPFPLPFIGNLHQLSRQVYLDLHQLSFRYGPVYRVRFGAMRAIVINSYSYAREAMVQKGSAFSGRPFHYGGSLFSRDGKGIGFQGYTPRLRLQRKAVIQTIRQFEKNNLEELIRTETEELISLLTRSQKHKKTGTMASQDLRKSIGIAQNYLVMTLSLGKKLKKTSNDFSNIVEMLSVFSEGLVATNIIDAFPFLKYFPLESIKKMKKACNERDEILDRRFLQHKRRFIQENALSSQDLADVLIEMSQKKRNDSKESLCDDHMIMTINDTIMAGTESSTSTLCWVIFFLVKYPQMQTRIQEELEQIVGQRKPTWNDRQNLPYLSAFITESMRKASVMPLALPHQSTRETSIGPYRVPKEMTVILNVYGVHNDPDIFENPHDFNPERFLHQDGTLNKEHSSRVIAFGLGNRICPGEVLARMELFLFVSRLLQHFTFRCNGDLPDINSGTFGLVNRSPEFRITIDNRL